MNIYEVKKSATYSIEDSAPFGDVRTIKEAFKLIKRSSVFDEEVLCGAQDLVISRLRDTGYYIDEYAGCEVSAYSATDYVVSLLLFAGKMDYVCDRSYKRVWAHVAFTLEDGVYTLTCTAPSVTIF